MSEKQEIPSELFDLDALEILILIETPIKSLPEDISRLISLKILLLEMRQELLNLPESLGKLKSLKELIIEGSNLKNLPQSIVNLEYLQILELNGDNLFYLPNEKHESTTAPHIPVLAGTYGVIQYILSRFKIPEGKLITSVGEFNAFKYPSESCLIKKNRHPKCICNDPIYQEVFNNKWEL